jgi:hypothetical protein
VFEVLRSRRPLQLAARSAILVAVSPVLFVASGIHGDPVAVAVALLLLATWVPTLAWRWPCCRPSSGCADARGGSTPPSAWSCSPPLALGPAWSPRDLVWPAVFGYLGDARWASIYAVTAGATLLWTSTWWGAGLPWHGGVDPATLPDGTMAGLGLVTWAVLGSWLVLGWRTVAVEAAAGPGPAPAGSGALAGAGAHAGAVDDRAHPATPSATLPPRGAGHRRG